MGYKCAPQVLGLVRGNPKNTKHRANGGKIGREAGNERFSKSETLDRTRSDQNEYDGMYGKSGSGQDCWDMMKAEADSYEIPVTLPNGGKATRGLRKDAVIGYAAIFNPPDEMCQGWDRETYNKFYTDSFETMQEIEPRIFRPDTIRMIAKHRDEGLSGEDGSYGQHEHILGVPKDENEHYCGNLIDAKLCNKINQKYPELMRKKGWDLDDLDVTDWEKYKTDKLYKKQRDDKRKEHGKSTNDYIAAQNKKHAVALGKKEQWLDQRDALLKESEAENEAIEMKLDRKYQKSKAKELDDREDKIREREREQDTKEEEQRARDAALNAREARVSLQENELGKLLPDIRELRENYNNGFTTLSQTVSSMKQELDKLVHDPKSSEIYRTARNIFLNRADKSVSGKRDVGRKLEAQSRDIEERDAARKMQNQMEIE